MNNWITTGLWGQTATAFYGNYGMSESPTGNYFNNQSITATMVNGVDLDTAVDAYVELTAMYNIEYAFDYCHIEATHDQGANWVTLGSFTGDSTWWRYNFSLSGFVGYDDVRCRLRFYSDQALNYDGFTVDEFKIYSVSEDINPPMILHTPMPHYEGSLSSHDITAEIADYSGVASAILHYWVDSISGGTITGNNYSGNNWLFTIPAQAPGAWLDYYIIAVDSSVLQNADTTKLFHYIAGNYFKYDNAIVDFVEPIGNGSLNTHAAVRFSLNGITDIKTALIRTYIDPFITSSDFEFHIWRNDSGVPGADLVVPFIVVPEANNDYPHRITRIDLRQYSDSLNGYNGDVFMGFTVPVTSTYVCETTPGIGNRTYVFSNGFWTLHTSDFHFRLITSHVAGSPQSLFSYVSISDPVVDFTDLSVGTPTSWLWDFDDSGITSTLQNPQHIFTDNGIYNVCLTVNNGIANNTSCQFVTIQNCMAPVAGFDYISSWSPEILFNDTSIGYPTTWYWEFGDGGSFGYLNPMHTYANNDTFTVCLIVTNSLGADTACQDIVIDTYTEPEASFSYDPLNSPEILFYDESSSLITNTPTSWYWDFDDNGSISTSVDPVHIFSHNGIFNVCLTAGNLYGDHTYCNSVVITEYEPPTADFSWDTIFSPYIQFLDQSTTALINVPEDWYWDFGDGSSSNNVNPQHTFAQNGNFNVCLIVENNAGSDTVCKIVPIEEYEIPIANFGFQNIDPTVVFTDYSSGLPDSWEWIFNDMGASSTTQHPSYTFTTNDTFEVCLIVANYLGSDTTCTNIIIGSFLPPQAMFTFDILLDSIVYFHDASTNNPTEWLWDFGYSGASSLAQNPNFSYPEIGTFQVCLVASNAIGASPAFCQDIIISLNGIEHGKVNVFEAYPNPFSDIINISGTFNSSQLKIYDILGQDISALVQIKNLSNTSLALNFERLPDSVYFISSGTSQNSVVLRVVKR